MNRKGKIKKSPQPEALCNTVPPHCIENTKSKKLKIEENGRKAIFSNNKGEEYRKYKIDNCIIKCEKKQEGNNKKAADWMISKLSTEEKNIHTHNLLVELKGKHVEHAFEQIRETAKFLEENKITSGKIAALIVCKQCPAVSTTIQKKKDEFARRFNGPIHIVSGNYIYNFDSLFTFGGLKKGKIDG